ncbi:hypothetical protein, partial [Cytobacillus sp. IB215665]|uniref:hypothetical protein n=1 Tax=Cytobacillus sp. IB215665 TaxID=3097357 RepID=UPI002A180973
KVSDLVFDFILYAIGTGPAIAGIIYLSFKGFNFYDFMAIVFLLLLYPTFQYFVASADIRMKVRLINDNKGNKVVKKKDVAEIYKLMDKAEHNYINLIKELKHTYEWTLLEIYDGRIAKVKKDEKIEYVLLLDLTNLDEIQGTDMFDNVEKIRDEDDQFHIQANKWSIESNVVGYWALCITFTIIFAAIALIAGHFSNLIPNSESIIVAPILLSINLFFTIRGWYIRRTRYRVRLLFKKTIVIKMNNGWVTLKSNQDKLSHNINGHNSEWQVIELYDNIAKIKQDDKIEYAFLIDPCNQVEDQATVVNSIDINSRTWFSQRKYYKIYLREREGRVLLGTYLWANDDSEALGWAVKNGDITSEDLALVESIR